MTFKENANLIVIIICSILVGVCISNIYFYSNPMVKEIYTYYNTTETLKPIIYEYNNTYYNFTYKTSYSDSQYDFMNALSENADLFAYKLGIYDCKNFTNSAYSKLKSLGYDVDRYNTRMADNKTFHIFMGMYIYLEPQSGRILTPSQYASYGIPNDLKEYDGENPYYYQNSYVSNNYREICKH